MRVTTDLFVSALIRRVFAAGGFAAVIDHGAAEAGAVFLLVRGRQGDTELYGPAPQTAYDAANPGERFFIRLDATDYNAADERLIRERRFDPDIWTVEVELPIELVESLIGITTP